MEQLQWTDLKAERSVGRRTSEMLKTITDESRPKERGGSTINFRDPASVRGIWARVHKVGEVVRFVASIVTDVETSGVTIPSKML